jgi:predicted dinucleotide-binding enzyme
MKKIGIFGSGAVAKTLAAGFIKYGYEVTMGTRDVTKLAGWNTSNGNKATIGSFEDAAIFGDIIILAVSGDAAIAVLDMVGKENLVGKTVIDTTNPIEKGPPQEGVLKYFSNINESFMEVLQKKCPETHFVKAFNSVGNAFMVNPIFKEGKPSMFICGNNENAKLEVTEILDLFGWEIEDMGKAAAARAIEPLCMLWCIPGFMRNEWSHAFKLMKQ